MKTTLAKKEEARAKARHATRMAVAACQLADTGADQLRQRVFGRHAVLFAHSGLMWLLRWRKSLSRERATESAAAGARPLVKEFEAEVARLELVRHYLAAKRQRAADARIEDIETTLHVWDQVNPLAVNRLVTTMIKVCDRLERVENPTAPSIRDSVELHSNAASALRDSSPRRDPGFVYVSGDTAAPLRPNTLWTFQGGELGRRIAEINDVAIHLDTLLRAAPTCLGLEDHDRLVRSAIFTELRALIDLSIGPPDGAKDKVTEPLVELLDPDRSAQAVEFLKEVRSGIAVETLEDTRTLRNWLGAHLHAGESFDYLIEVVDGVDYQGYLGLCEYMLDSLDAIGSVTLDLGQLLLVEVKTHMSIEDPHAQALLSPQLPDMTQLFEVLDSPHVALTSTSFGSPMLAGIQAGRVARPREPIKLPAVDEIT